MSSFYFLSDAGVSHKVLHIKSGMFFHLLACLVKQYQTQEILSTSTYKGWKILATHLSLCKRGLFFLSEWTVSNITGQLARKRERNGEANYFCELAKGHFKLCAHDIIMFMVNIIVRESECMAWEAGKKRHQSQIENNLLRSEMRQLRGKDQKEKKKKKPTLQEPHTWLQSWLNPPGSNELIFCC